MAQRFLYSLLLLLLLSACQPGGFSTTPEQAASQAVQFRQQRQAVINPDTFEVRQTQEQDQSVFVLLSYQQVTQGRQEDCLDLVETEKNRLGFWRVVSSGGGCRSQVGGGNAGPVTPLEIGAGHSGSNIPSKPGHSSVYGLAHQDNIETVRITWANGTSQEIVLQNGSFLALQTGQLDCQKVEGLDQTGAVVYTFSFEIAPGKHRD